MALKVLKYIILFFEFSNVDVDVFPDPIIKIFKFTFVISSLTGVTGGTTTFPKKGERHKVKDKRSRFWLRHIYPSRRVLVPQTRDLDEVGGTTVMDEIYRKHPRLPPPYQKGECICVCTWYIEYRVYNSEFF
uniref:Uncharacterized protein n=1 Tax=Vespula pensylvanica TaxID=30213 RepID=A0A834PG11_VESPE|nr:hypothetical protein H0235_001419 [Vespula pensylvanica]